ncbi:carboxypeptidase-like regulatory domain-containing protein [Myxococcota bacterium]|nr:carboxypeptidase-like regulatory domain-containing protein [Myxococcota bacterium]MBU1413803.1 carboxypeptidase-like regulatory domain-containing protein [Myxococcota bacterium]MBU1510330.1 carboxypeptidase-like regulatory domain-containing protein [Myxococcota bacterium]
MTLHIVDLRRMIIGMLSAGGALVLAACYGPVRQPVGPISGTVRDADGPLPGASVCVRVKGHPEEAGPCTKGDGDGKFTVPRFQSRFPAHEICVSVPADAPGLAPRETCVPLDPGTAGNTVINLSKNRR